MNLFMPAGIAAIFIVFSTTGWASDDKNNFESAHKKTRAIAYSSVLVHFSW
jgi:hypothetical protein